MSASVKVVAGLDDDEGRDLPALAEVARLRRRGPSVAMPPLPFSPVKFSGLIERVCAFDRRDRLPRCRPNPENAMMSSIRG